MMDKPKVKKKWLHTLVGATLSLTIVVWLLSRVDLDIFRGHLQSFSFGAVLFSSILILMSLPLRTLQWKLLLGDSIDTRTRDVFRAICFGHLANIALPMRGGEIVKAGILKRHSPLTLERIVTSMVLCRLQDLLPVCLLFLFFLTQLSSSDLSPLIGEEAAESLSRGIVSYTYEILVAQWPIILALTIGIALGYAFVRRHAASNDESWLGMATSWLRRRIKRVYDSVRYARRPITFTLSMCMAILCWVLFVGSSVPLLMSTGQEFFDAIYVALLITGATTFFQLIPSAPTAIGTFHLGCTFALTWAIPSITEEAALAFAVVLHAVGALTPALPGLLLLVIPRASENTT